MTSRRLTTALLLALALSAAFLFPTLGARSYFAGDLLYYWLPRKAFILDALQAGRFPLWDPYFRAGLPFFANPDNAVLDPFQIPFFFLSFASGLKLFYLLTYPLMVLAGFLWGQKLGQSRTASLFLGALLGLGGYALARAQFLPQVSTLAACLLLTVLVCGEMPWAAGLALALVIFAGHWQTAAVALIGLGIVSWVPFRKHWRNYLCAGASAVLFSTVILFPAWEALRNSSWGTESILRGTFTANSLAPEDWRGILYFSLGKDGNLDAMEWTRFFAVGLIPALLGAFDWSKSGGRRKAATVALVAAGLLLSGGMLNGISRRLYGSVDAFRFFRYPTRWIFLAVLPTALLASFGLGRIPGKWRWGAATLAVLQLFWHWSGLWPAVGNGYFRDRGELAAFLQNNLGEGERFFFSLRAERLLVGYGADRDAQARDLRDRLYVRTPILFHLYQLGGFGEPWPARGVDGYLEDLETQGSPDRAEPWLTRGSASLILASDPLETKKLTAVDGPLWKIYRNPAALPRAYWMTDGEWRASQDPALPRTQMRSVQAGYGEDRVGAEGQAEVPGRLVLSDAFYPGWKAWVNGRPVGIERDSGAFRAVGVPEKFTAVFLYRPMSFLAGLGVTVLSGVLAAGLALRKLKKEGV